MKKLALFGGEKVRSTRFPMIKEDAVCDDSAIKKSYEFLNSRLRGVYGLISKELVKSDSGDEWFYKISIDETNLGTSSEEYIKALKAEGIPCEDRVRVPINELYTHNDLRDIVSAVRKVSSCLQTRYMYEFHFKWGFLNSSSYYKYSHNRKNIKTGSIFYSKSLIENIRKNICKYSWAKEIRDNIVQQAEPWRKLSDDELWGTVFGNTLSRSLMVWSNGYCPFCRKNVSMYDWLFDPFNYPWKAKCPHCGDLFPKNDFYSYYLSGLDDNGIFSYTKADSSLLYNIDHPDNNDPLRMFGVDDGDGYIDPETGNCWRFIAGYLIRGQWKKLILDGLIRLSDAYLVTGERIYSRKAGILLDRLADLLADHEFGMEGYCYGLTGNTIGYISYGIDSCIEMKHVALSYDKIFDGIKDDKELVDFLSKKAIKYGVANKKSSFADIRSNIEERILVDILKNPIKVTCNLPYPDLLIIITKTILDYNGFEKEINEHIDAILERTTCIDGLTGEKGLAAYSALEAGILTEFLKLYSTVDKEFLPGVFKKHLSLAKTFRFFTDTLCLGKYYPNEGDANTFAAPARYDQSILLGMILANEKGKLAKDRVDKTIYSFIWEVYKIIGDINLARLLYRNNGFSCDGLPYDLLSGDIEEIQDELKSIIEKHGHELEIHSCNKEQWHLALLRSGYANVERVVWLDYDSGNSHGHNDGMNIGLFAKGLDLMPDYGYIPVHIDGVWGGRFARWTCSTPAHNTITVDGKNDKLGVSGKTSLWAVGNSFKAVRASGAELIDGKQFERTVALIDISDSDSYIVDVFRVIGGIDHARFINSTYGTIKTQGLDLKPAAEYGHNTEMRNFYGDTNPKEGWSVEFMAEDYFHFLPQGTDVYLKYTDLSPNAAAYIAEAWVAESDWSNCGVRWIPKVMIRRRKDIDSSDEKALESAFVGVFEPYENSSNISAIKRLELYSTDGTKLSEFDVAIEVTLTNGYKDLVVFTDVEDVRGLKKHTAESAIIQKDWNLSFNGDSCFIRTGLPGVEKIALCGCKQLKVKNVEVILKRRADIMEIDFTGNIFKVLVGEPSNLEKIVKQPG